ncbi:MAG: pyridoxal phosphate-dependent aminotransferase [Candidatus Marinimicrobia bacterium]|jgi:aspartate/methionine/tyrosine aminotransferase|nr:pyridoxal phosphate-dependent aminotransferase [Candidatus Neomarinimicrobiota bacterium]MDP6853116.1 pyridoxal phosphate-dependent aminotransferase [Candidatus Neomarinimicrobiota bacterium]MDP6936480.1 pyridoxal phosphate-dependent aminotransferase [Candidatus Neomarinimicrobiota bacterium]
MNQNTVFPLNADFLTNRLADWEINLEQVSIRELNRLVDELSDQFQVEFLRFEFGIPGLKPNILGPETEIDILSRNPALAGSYPPFDGVPLLKQAAAEFVDKFLNISVPDLSCIPTVGAMHGGLICQSIAGRIHPQANTILYLDPGFPVNKLQNKFLGLQEESIDLIQYRGTALIDKIESILEKGKIGGLLWSSPNNPSWVCLKEEELKGIGELLTRYDVLGIEDAAYLGMDYRQDYSKPGEPPFIPTVARYTDNYFIIISSSKIFSYAGQRIAITVISPELLEKRYPNLRQYYNTERVGHAFIHGGIYPTTAGVPQTPQYALASLFNAAIKGDYNFLEDTKVYARRAKKMKDIFLQHNFHLAYDEDMGEPISDGFYFTVTREGMKGGELLFEMLRFGLAGIPLSTTGSIKDGVRICVSLIREDQFPELDKRLIALDHSLQPEPI